MLAPLAALALGYLLGSVSAAGPRARARGVVIDDVGSGNPGAMNVARNLGWGAGLLVLAVDVGKGALAAALGLRMGAMAGAEPDAALALGLAAGVGSVAGHAWPPLRDFRGGKSLATLFGAFLPLAPAAALFGLGVLVALVLLLRRVAWASSLALLSFPLVAYGALARAGWEREPTFLVVTAVGLASLVSLIRHLPSLRRGDGRAF